MSKIRTDDDFLREHGFAIHSRPKQGEAIWSRGDLWTQSKALVQAVIEEEQAAIARAKAAEAK